MPWEVLKFEKFLEWVAADGGVPRARARALSAPASRSLSVGLVVLAVAAVVWLYQHNFAMFRGLTERSKLAGAGYTFLGHKYYLDDLYEKVIVHGISGPIARAANWINQKVIDAVVNGVGVGGKLLGRWTYKNIDQTVVDGAVNGAGFRRRGVRVRPAHRPDGQGPAVRRAALRRRRHRRPRPRHRRLGSHRTRMIPITDNNWALSVAVFLPLAGVAVMLFIPRAEEQLHKLVALVTSLATAGVGVYLLVTFDYDRAGDLQFYVDKPWIDVIHSRYILGLDGISLPAGRCSPMFIMVLCIVYSLDHIPDPGNAKAFLMLILLLEVGMVGTFVAQDLILFFVFFEVVLLPMYFMIGVWGGEQRQYAAIKFFLFTLFGSALMLLSFLALFFKTGADDVLDPRPARPAWPASDIRAASRLLIFGGMFMGFAIKVPMFPFHTWLPDAHTQAPTVGSVILAADPAEARHLRLHPHRHPDPARRRRGLGAVDRLARRDRHHLRRAVLPGPDRHEAPHRLLVGVPHGLRRCSASRR